MASRQILTNTYIPRKTKKGKYEWYEHDLVTYFDDLKYEEFTKDGYFQDVKLWYFIISVEATPYKI